MFNRRLAACFVAAALICGGTAVMLADHEQPVQTAASAEYKGDLKYSSVSGGVAINGYKGKGGAVEIPSEINGSKVVAISKDAFSQCDSITSVTIPSSVKTIGDNAFFYCTSLKSVTIPEGVSSIGVCAFSGCSDLRAVKLPKSMKTVKEAAFSDCTGLSSVTIADGAVTFKYEAFLGCTSLKTVKIPKKVSSIEDNAFGFCISNDEKVNYNKLSGFKIKCYMNSDAYIYAVENSLKYEILDPDTPDTVYFTNIAIPDEDDLFDEDTTGDESGISRGDVNGDGVVNVTDASLIAGLVKGNVKLSNRFIKRADINRDGHVDVADLSLLSAYVKGMRSF